MELNEYIDHTILKPDATDDMVLTLCSEARKYSFKSVCVNPCNVALAKSALGDCGVLVCSVIGFPLGASTIKTKVFEAKGAVCDGADEIDMVINVGKAKSGDWGYVLSDIMGVVEACPDATVKVIIETCLLTDDEKRRACICAMEAGAHFVKTSTGFSKGGATVEDVKLMREVVGSRLKVKASGGIRDLAAAKAMIAAGADRIGTSNGIAIVTGE